LHPRRRGNEVVRVLAVTNLRAPFVKKQVDSLRAIHHEVELLYADRTTGGRRVYLTLGRAVRRAVAEIQPDVVHVIYGGVMADIVTRSIKDVPVVVTFCGSDLIGSSGGQRLLKRLSVRYGIAASRRAAVRACAVAVESKGLMDALPKAVDPSRIWIVPDGVDLSLFKPHDQRQCQMQLGWNPSAKHVLFPASRDRPEKRFQLAEAAVAKIQGDGWDVHLHELAGVPHESVPIWLNAADVVVLTSTHEGSPNTIKEALACNIPFVSVDVGDVRERMRGVEGCFLASPSRRGIRSR
jgi:teichuronic acid biosynthesis glycosyltransferase TuaC